MSGAAAGVSLNWLLDGIATVPENQAHVEDLTLDSREVRTGSLFFALAGREHHGLEFAADAAARGASVVLWEPAEGVPMSSGTAVAGRADAAAAAGARAPFSAPVANLRQLVGHIADRFFGRPSSSMRIVGITGTNGKTTSAYLLAQCLERLGIACGYIGTLGAGRVDALESLTTHTTPDVISVHRRLAALRDASVSDVAMEVSSHALDQGRVDGVRFHTAAFTNLTRDHLDYHASMAAYGAAKARLFAVAGLRHRVINTGDAFGRGLAKYRHGALRTVDEDAAALLAVDSDDALLTTVWVGDEATGGRAARSLFTERVEADLRGIAFDVRGSLGRAQIRSRLLGRFNAENSLVVLGCLRSLGVELSDAAAALSGCHAPPGRMELVEAPGAGTPVEATGTGTSDVEASGAGTSGTGASGVAASGAVTRSAGTMLAGTPSRRQIPRRAWPLAVIDYAHTPDALSKALSAVREHCRGELWCVFGCGGDRDAGKRPLMGAVAEELADRIIVTDDNPRTEDPAAIVRAILAGMGAAGTGVVDTRPAGADEAGAMKAGAGEAGAGEAGAGDAGAGEASAGEASAGEVGAGEVGAGEAGAMKARAGGVGAGEASVSEAGAVHGSARGARATGGAREFGGARGARATGGPAARVRVVHDRGRAIAAALEEAAAADAVLIAGKGHEDYQIYGAIRRDFSDRREALRIFGSAA